MLENKVDESYNAYFGRLVGYARDVSKIVYPPLFVLGLYDFFTGSVNKENDTCLKIAVGAYVLNKVLKVITWFFDSDDVFAQKNKQYSEDIENNNLVGAQNLSQCSPHFLAQQQYRDDLEKRITAKFDFPSNDDEWKKFESVVYDTYTKLVNISGADESDAIM